MEYVKNDCCNKLMIELNVINFLGNMDTRRFVCSDCGKIIDINTYNLDDEELIDLIENNEELQDTEIHNKLKKELKE